MSLLLALSPLALAQGFAPVEGVPCASERVGAITPPDGAVDVPLDVVPSLTFWDSGCEIDGVLQVELVRLDGEAQETIFTADIETTVDPPTWWAPVPLDAQLAEQADYLLRVAGREGMGPTVEVGFSTGSSLAGLPTERPVMGTIEASWGRERGGLWSILFASADAAPDPHDLAVLLIRDADAPDVLFGAGYAQGEGGGISISADLGGERQELCLEAAQLDARAQEAAVSQPICVTPQRQGCSAVGGVGGGLLLTLSGLLGALRRRR